MQTACSATGDWLSAAWSRLHHPRTISAVYGIWWFLPGDPAQEESNE